MPERDETRPERLLDRDREWSLLREFVADPAEQLRLAIVLPVASPS